MTVRLGPVLAALGLTLAGCAGLAPADHWPRTDPVSRLSPSAPSPWREDLGDPVLHALLIRADTAALDPKVALARLERAQAEVEAADAAGAWRLTAGAAGAVGGRTLHSTTSAATPTLEVAREVDLWGRSGLGREAARFERGAAAADIAAARLAVSAQTAQAYLALREAQTAEGSWSRRRALADRGAGLVRARAAAGVATEADVEARRAASAAAEEATRRAQEAGVLQAARLRDLTGSLTPVELGASALSLGPAPGDVPSNVVDNRPDVRAARARLAAADQRRAAAVAASRPQFQLVAALGAPDSGIANLLDVRALAWAVAASVTHEVLDGGARRASVHIATAEADLADLQYRQSVLAAWSEIREALVAEVQARRALEAAQAAEAASRAALAAGEARHDAGAADGLAMVALQDSLEQAASTVSLARLEVAEARVRRALATGGG